MTAINTVEKIQFGTVEIDTIRGHDGALIFKDSGSY